MSSFFYLAAVFSHKLKLLTIYHLNFSHSKVQIKAGMLSNFIVLLIFTQLDIFIHEGCSFIILK